MPRNHFLNILTAIHICNVEEDATNERRKKAGQDYDPLFKIKPLIQDIQLACNTYYVPGQNVSIDGRMVASKARFCMKLHQKQACEVGIQILDSNCSQE